MMRSYILRLAFVASFMRVFAFAVQAQDPMFSQFFAAPQQLNPALVGMVDAPVLYANYRNQWSNINRAYATYSLAYGQYAPSINSGFGLSLLADVAGNGIYSTTAFAGNYAYDVRFDDNFYIRMGLEMGMVNKRLNWNKLVFFDQINPETGAYDSNGNLNPTEEGQIMSSINYFDVGAGLLVRTRWWYAGASFKHLNQPNEAYYRLSDVAAQLPVRASFHAGGEIPLGKRNKGREQAFISPNLLFVKQRQFMQLNFGAYISRQNLFGGLFFRHAFGNGDALIAAVGFSKGVFKLAYSYDLTVSSLTPASGGTHELSLVLNFEDKTKKQRQRYNDCTKLFR